MAETQTKLIAHGLTSRHSYLSFRHAGHATPAPTATATPTTSPTSIPTSTPTPLPSPSAIGGIVELVADPDAQSERSASSAPLPLPASVALGLLVIGACGLYVVRMRRG